MKNNTLKKISAIALAAVMAVTFAPVASLQAFAADREDSESAANTIKVSGTGISTVDGWYADLGKAVDALNNSSYTDATITFKKKAFTANATTVVTGSALTAGSDTKVIAFGAGTEDKKKNVTIDLADCDQTTLNGVEFHTSHDVNLTIKGKSGAKDIAGVKIGDQGGEAWGKSSLTIAVDAGTSVGNIDATFADVTLNSGIVGNVTFEAGTDETINRGVKSVRKSINASTFTMNGGWIKGELSGAKAGAFKEVKSTYSRPGDTPGNPTGTKTETKLVEGLGKVTINAGIFSQNPLGDTNANCKFDNTVYNNKDTVATWGFYYNTTDITGGQNASMIGDTPVVRLDLGANSKSPSGKIGAEDLYYAGQAFIDKMIASIKDDTDNFGTYKNWFVNTNNEENVEVVANPVEIKKAPWGTIVKTVNHVDGSVVSPTKATVTPADGLSIYETTKVETSGTDLKTTTYMDYIGDKTIIAAVGNKSLEDAKKELTDANKASDAKFTNGGDTLEVVADKATYVTPAKLNSVLKSAKEINVVELSSREWLGSGFKYALLGSLDNQYVQDTQGKYQWSNKDAEKTDGVNKDAVVTADKKYTIVSATKNGKRYVTVTNARVLNDRVKNTVNTAETAIKAYSTHDVLYVPVAPYDNGKDASVLVETIGEGKIADSADEILFVEGIVPTTKDKSLVLANGSNIAGKASAAFVGTKAAQIAAVSKEGRDIYTSYYVARKGDYLPAPYAFSAAQEYTQGDVYLTEVPRDNQNTVFNGNGWTESIGAVWDKDAVTTWTEFVDMAGLGITKTPNITTNAYGVDMVSSVNVQVGDDNVSPRSVYRFRNTKNGEHLYTVQLSEINNLLKSDEWVLENANAFTVLPYNTTVAGAVPVRRYHNIKTNEFLYSTDVNGEQKALDADPNWVREGIAFCGLPTGQGYAVTRVTNTIFGGHVYSTSVKNEVTPLVESGRGYKVDGVVFNAVETPEKEK